MPSNISLRLAAIWLAVGACTGFGWTLGAWLASQLLH